MASVLTITREGPSVYLNERMGAAFEILQSDGSTLSLPLSDAGNGPPAALKGNVLLHKHAQPIFYSILSLWRGLYVLVPLLYNRWVDALCRILSHSFTVASRPICAQYAAHTCVRSTRFIWQLTPRPAMERERQRRRGGTKAKEVDQSCLIKPVTIRQRLQLVLARFIPPRDAVMERGGKRQTGGGIGRLEPRDLSECCICCVWQRRKAGGEDGEIGIIRNFTNFNVLIPFPLNDLIIH